MNWRGMRGKKRPQNYRDNGNHRVDLARHDAAAGLQGGQRNFLKTGQRTAIHKAQIVSDLGQCRAGDFQLSR